MRRALPVVLCAAAGCLALLLGSPASAERAQKGNVIVSLNGDVAPRELPRSRPAPVAVNMRGEIRTDDRSALPRMRRVELKVVRRGRVFTRGLPVCNRRSLEPSNSNTAIDLCGPALIGQGRLVAKIFLPNQAPYEVTPRLLAFNGRTGSGRQAVWVHAYVRQPSATIVLPFYVKKGATHTEFVGVVPKDVGPWPRVARFEITFYRRYRYRGVLRSYISASCPVPPSFTAGFVAFAKASFLFADDRRINVESVRSCRGR
jgi:hypothetical protein